MKKITAILLTLMLTALILCGCESTQQKMEALAGTYSMTATDTEEQIKTLLDSIEAYDEEIALVDMSSLEYVRVVKFDAQGNYSYAYDTEGTRACVRSFYEGYFDALYKGRTSLNEVYSQSFDEMTQEEFFQFYASLYACADYTALLDTLTENAYDYQELAEPWEEGTYTIASNKILCTIAGETTAESMQYLLDGTTLKLTYSNTTELYTKVS